MSTLPASGYLSNSARTNGEQKAAFEQQRDFIAQLIGGNAAESLGIISGAVTPSRSFVILSAETGTTDTLNTASAINLPAGSIMILQPASGHTITLADSVGGSGQMDLNGGNKILSPGKTAWLLSDGTNWSLVMIGGDVAASAAVESVIHVDGAHIAALSDAGKSIVFDSDGAMTIPSTLAEGFGVEIVNNTEYEVGVAVEGAVIKSDKSQLVKAGGKALARIFDSSGSVALSGDLSDVPVSGGLMILGPRVTHPSATFTRSTTGTYIGSDGLQHTAAIDQPRYAYDPVTHAYRGLLIEEARTNTMYPGTSIAANTGLWAAPGNTILTPNVVAGTNGLLTASSLVEDSTNNPHFIGTGPAPFTPSVVNCVSVRLKAIPGSAKRYFGLLISSGITADAITVTLNFDIATKTITNSSGTIVASGAFDDANGYATVWVAITAAASPSGSAQYRLGSTAGAVSSQFYLGDGTSGFYITDAQVEAAAFPSSYIPTTTASATRATDIATIATADIAGFSASEGAFVLRGRTAPGAGAQVIVSLNDGTANNSIKLHRDASNNIKLTVTNSNVGQADITIGTVANSTDFSVAFGWKANDFAASLNGGIVSTDTSGTIPTVTTIEIGAQLSASQMDGTDKDLSYYPRRLTDTELQAAST